MTDNSPEVRSLTVKKATPESLSDYGQILGHDPNIAPMPIDFYGGAVKVHRVVDFVSDDRYTQESETRTDTTKYFKHTQTFIPLDGAPFVVVMAPPNDDDMADLDKVEAFLFDGSAGFTMKLGTWHEFPFAVEDDTNIIVVLRREATDGLIRDNVIQDEARSPDLDKKDLLQRANVLFQFEL